MFTQGLPRKGIWRYSSGRKKTQKIIILGLSQKCFPLQPNGAATLGDLETMKWAIAENTGTTGTAANHPIESSSDFFVPVIEAAASGGHIHILEYLRPTGILFRERQFYARVTGAAARHGHEEEVDEEAEVIVVQEEYEDDEQEDEVVEDEEVAVDEEDDAS
eukprot:gene24050-30348_t